MRSGAAVAIALLLACAGPFPVEPAPIPPAEAPAPAPPAGERPQESLERVRVGRRAAWVHVPARTGRDPLPLVVVVATRDGQRSSQWFSRWFDQGVLFAFADARRGARSDDLPETWDGAVDGPFVRDLVAELRRTELVGPAYLVAYGPGGHLGWDLACDTAGGFDGYAVVSQNLPRSVGRACATRAGPAPLLVVAGTDDRWSPWAGDPDTFGVEPTLELLAGRHGCSGERLVEVADRVGDGMHVVRHVFTCTRANLELVEVDGGGRAWPGSDHPLATRDIDGADVVLQFFGLARGPP
ncbi:MAG: hypothetical protein ABMA64_37735 [Myxococcota bacterium]